MLNEALVINKNSEANPGNIIQTEHYRITVIFDRLIRMELSPGGEFHDKTTARIWERDFGEVSYNVYDDKNLIITTDKIILTFNKRVIRPSIKIEFIMSGKKIVWYYPSVSGNLKGTRRTLDATFGAVHLSDGIISQNGVAILDDSRAVVLENGLFSGKEYRSKDFYIFVYGHDYYGALQDFYRLTGRMPLLPRFALGNWWSRYHAYSDTEYLELLDDFIHRGVPISVATLDMDWHITEVPRGTGSGWTGYTWNNKLFPEPKKFLDAAKARGCKLVLNPHPADGVRPHEEAYTGMAEAMGIDPLDQTIPFAMPDERFVNAYFDVLHHPQEEAGVDFWWIDWQQGRKTDFSNIDPLLMLNHYHYLDNAKDGRRPLILSRYSGIGSHRYQIGFSGDTAINWPVLRFQPYFNACAANVGYSWWSNDIGGHHLGRRDDEMYLRWVQLGVFSPILRLHSSNNEFIGKEPWNYRRDICEYVMEALRLRARLIPYIYTMNYRNHIEGKPLICPMYYDYPEEENVYKSKYRNQYLFGTELIIAPITVKSSRKIEIAGVKVWLPKGRYIDLFTDYIYDSNGGEFRMFRKNSSIPVLLKEGGILILDGRNRLNMELPQELDIHVFPGRNSGFSLYEDNGTDLKYKDGEYAFTHMVLEGGTSDFSFYIEKARGNAGVAPLARTYNVFLRGIGGCADIVLEVDGKPEAVEKLKDGFGNVAVVIANRSTKRDIKLVVKGAELRKTDKDKLVKDLISMAQINNTLKLLIARTDGWINSSSKALMGAIREIERIE